MNWNWLGWLLWIAAIVFMIWVTHYIRVKQLMLIAKTKRRFDKKLFARYVVLVVLAIGWLGGMAYLSFFRRVSYDDTQAVKITTEYEALQLNSQDNDYYYVIDKHAQGGTRPIVSYTYWTDNAKMTTDARGTTIVDSDRLVTGQAAGYPWNMKKLKSYDSKTGHAFVAVMTIKYRNTVLNGMGVRCGKLADTHTLIRIPAANMVDQKK
jgi:hypothetical protein